MLVITIGTEAFDEETQRFFLYEPFELVLEHSLVSLSKWESIWETPFLSLTDKTVEQTQSYIRCMILTPNPPDNLFQRFDKTHYDAVQSYIESKQSATTFGETPEVKSSRGETITAELIYYWLVAFNIDWEAQYWHLNRLLSLIRICNVKNTKPKKMTKGEIAERNRKLNEERKAKYGTRG